jgi:hypothetical protein
MAPEINRKRLEVFKKPGVGPAAGLPDADVAAIGKANAHRRFPIRGKAEADATAVYFSSLLRNCTSAFM